MCVIQVKYQCGGSGSAFQSRCKCTTTKTVSSATQWCHEYECYRCRVRFEGVPTADGAIYDYLRRFDSEDDAESFTHDDVYISPSDDGDHYTAVYFCDGLKRAQKEYGRNLPESALYRRQETDNLHRVAHQISVFEKDLHRVAGLAFFWLDELRRTSCDGCCWWHEESLPAASILAAACELQVPIKLSFAEVTLLIRDTLVHESLEELVQNLEVSFHHSKNCDWEKPETYSSANVNQDGLSADVTKSIVEEVTFKASLRRLFKVQSLWWFSDLQPQMRDFPGDLREFLPTIATQRPYPGAHPGMWELNWPGADHTE